MKMCLAISFNTGRTSDNFSLRDSWNIKLTPSKISAYDQSVVPLNSISKTWLHKMYK